MLGKILGYAIGGLAYWVTNKYLALALQNQVILRFLPIQYQGGTTVEILATILTFTIAVIIAEILTNRFFSDKK